MTKDNADVAAVLEALRQEVRARRQASGGAAGDGQSALERELQRCAEQLEITRVVSAHWPLEGRNLYQRAWALVNKVVRRYLRWYINPIVEQQNAFNDVAARTLRLLIEAHGELRVQTAELEKSENGGSGPADQTGGGDKLLPTDQLQALVEERGAQEPPAALTDLALRPLPAQLSQRQLVHAHWPLEGRTPYERALVLLHKLVRRYLRWLVNPIVEQQNAFNTAISAAVPPLLMADLEARSRLAVARAEQAGRRGAR